MSIKACYEYPDECGRVLLRKWRFEATPAPTHEVPFPLPKKKFNMEGRSRDDYMFIKPLTVLYPLHPDLRDYFHSLLYRLPDFLEAVQQPDHGTLYLTEGERDADSINAAGGLAVSHWQGAGSATPAQANRLKGWQGTVVVCADEDPKGAACALRRYRLLREAGIPTGRMRIVKPAGPYVEKRDVTDHLQDGYTLDELVPMDIQKLERWVSQTPASQLKEKEGSESYNDAWAPRAETSEERAERLKASNASKTPQTGEGRGSRRPAPLSAKPGAGQGVAESSPCSASLQSGWASNGWRPPSEPVTREGVRSNGY